MKPKTYFIQGGFILKKFLDTSNLVTYQSGKYQGKYDWSNNVGKELYFEYDDLSGYIKIIDYVKDIPYGQITLQYNDMVVTTTTSNLVYLKIPRLFHKEKQKRRYNHETGDIIHKFNDTLKVIDQIRIDYNNSSCRGYKLECMDCGYVYESREDKISTCPICGEKSSYSERFIYSILKQANINFEPQKEFNWLPIRYYDAYLPDYNTIIEIHGLQHYKPTKMNNQYTSEEIYQQAIEADKLKYDTAISNGLNYYIINASNQKLLFEEANKVLTFIDFTRISKKECIKFANYKDIRQECELWNQGFSTHEIAKKLNKPLSTVQTKLRIGNECGMCIYDKHINMSNARKLQIRNIDYNKNNVCKPVRCITTNKIFKSITEATKYYNLSKTGISDCLSGKCKTCGIDSITKERLKWEYYSENKTS